MVEQDDVRRTALALPETVEDEDRFAFHVRSGQKLTGFAWVWLERVEPKNRRVPRPNVLAVRVADQSEKDLLLAASWDKVIARYGQRPLPPEVINP